MHEAHKMSYASLKVSAVCVLRDHLSYIEYYDCYSETEIEQRA